MKDSLKKGVGFGLASAIITTLGVIVGLHSSTDLRHAIIGAILVLAFVDSMADSLGLFLSEKSSAQCTTSEAGTSMAAAFLTKFLLALSFLVPIIFFTDLHVGIIVDIIYGAVLLIMASVNMARERKESAFKTAVFHILLAVIVISVSHLLGLWVNSIFG